MSISITSSINLPSNETIFEKPAHVVSYVVGDKQPNQLVSFDRIEKQVKSIGDNQVFVELICSSICHADLSTFNSKGCIPGHEMVGIIKQVGQQVAKKGRLQIGMRVGIGYQYSSCLHCETCENHHENLCDSIVNFTKAPLGGGFQTGVVWDAHFVFPIPEKLKSIHAAPLLCAGVSVFTALYRHGKSLVYTIPGRKPTCAILGLGGLGHLAIQYAKKMGFHVSALSSSANKEDECKRFGADEFYVYTKEDNQFKSKFDIILNTVSGNIDVDMFVSMLRPFGKMCMLGVPNNPKYEISVFNLLGKSRSIVTSIIGSPEEIELMLQFSAEHNINPQVELTTLDRVEEAVERVHNNQARYRIVMIINHDFVNSENQ